MKTVPHRRGERRQALAETALFAKLACWLGSQHIARVLLQPPQHMPVLSFSPNPLIQPGRNATQ